MQNFCSLTSRSWAEQWGFQLKTTGKERNMSIKPHTCKYCILVCKQTQQASSEYESITVNLDWMHSVEGDCPSRIFLHFMYAEMLSASTFNSLIHSLCNETKGGKCREEENGPSQISNVLFRFKSKWELQRRE